MVRHTKKTRLKNYYFYATIFFLVLEGNFLFHGIFAAIIFLNPILGPDHLESKI